MPEPPVSRFRRWYSPKIREQLFQLVVLLNILPAVRILLFYGLFGFPITLKNYRSQSPEFLWIFGAVTVIGTLTAIGLIVRRKYGGLLGLLPVLAPYLFVFASYMRWKDVDAAGNVHPVIYLYFLFVQLSFLYFIAKGKMRSPAYLIVVALLFFWSGLLETLMFLGYTVLFRFLYFAWKQNVQILKDVGRKRLLWLLGKAFLFWCPLLLFIIPTTIFSGKLNRSALDAVYHHSFVESLDEEKKYEISQFERNLDAALSIKRGETFTAIEQERQRLIAEIEQTGEMPAEMAQSMASVVPDDLTKLSSAFEPQKCGLLNVKCGVKNWTKKELAKAYRDARNNAFDQLNATVADASKKGVDQIKSKVNYTALEAKNRVNTIYDGLGESLSLIFWSIVLFGIVMDILLGLIIIKSFMYVFARVAFTANDRNYVTFMEDEYSGSQGEIHKHGRQFTIPATEQHDFYVSRAYEPSGRAPKFVIPQKTKATVGRLFTRNYAMNKIVMSGRDEPVYFRGIGSQEFVEWQVREGEEVIFHFSSFVGMSESIRLSAIISLRLTSLLMGRVVFTSAKGPGKIILHTEGEPAVTGDPKAEASVATSRILAWDKNARFHVESELNPVDVFMSGIYLKKQADDLVLIDADKKGKASIGIFQFIKHFLLPF